MKRDFQKELRTLKEDMIGHIKSNLPIEDINERIDVIVCDYDCSTTIETITVETITEDGSIFDDDGGRYVLDEVCVYDLAFLCNNYCKN